MANLDGYMNKSYGSMMEEGKSAPGEKPAPKPKPSGHGAKPHIHIHSHSGGHTVHIMHPDGRHEMHEHPHGDADGIAQHIHDHLGEGSAPEGHEGGSLQEVAGER